VQRAFKLGGLIPSAEVLSADVVRIQPLLREAREQLAGAKDAWLKAASGRAENLPKLKQTLASVHNKAADIRNGALMKLTAALVERLDKMPASACPSRSPWNTRPRCCSPRARSRTTRACRRTSRARSTRCSRDSTPRARDARRGERADARRDEQARAGARAARAGGREIQANLRHMEQVLDAFFRDHAKRADLRTLAKDSSQIRGALRMLGLDDAGRLLELCQQQIDTYAIPRCRSTTTTSSCSPNRCRARASTSRRRAAAPDRDRLIAPLLAKRLGEAPAQAPAHADSVENAVPNCARNCRRSSRKCIVRRPTPPRARA
jgi:chemosensory pili system protein ChpA (sensor histidine kinase/response regulator)